MSEVYNLILEDEYEEKVTIGKTEIIRNYCLINIVMIPGQSNKYMEIVTKNLNEKMIPYQISSKQFWENTSAEFICLTEYKDKLKETLTLSEEELLLELSDEEHTKGFGSTSLVNDDDNFHFLTTGVSLPNSEGVDEKHDKQ